MAATRASSSNAWPETMRLGGLVRCIMLFVGASRAAARAAKWMERAAKQGCKGAGGPGASARALHVFDGLFGGAALVAEIGERGDDVGFEAGARRGPRRFRQGDGGELVAQLDDHALGGLPADAGDARELRQIARANRGDEFVHAHAGKDFQREHGADARSGKE